MSGWATLFGYVWIFGPFAFLIGAGFRDERRGSRDALGLAMGCVALVIITHVIVFARMGSQGPSCGFF